MKRDIYQVVKTDNGDTFIANVTPKKRGFLTGFIFPIIIWLWHISLLISIGFLLLVIFTSLRLFETYTNKIITNNKLCHSLFRYFLQRIMDKFHLCKNGFAKWLFDIDYLVVI